MKKTKDFKKSGKEIKELYKNVTKAGITPEEGMLFLLAHMEKTKASEIGMDIKGEDGHTFCLKVSVLDGSIDDNDQPLSEQKRERYGTSMVV